MFMNCCVVDDTIDEDQWRVNWFVSFGRKNNCFSLSFFHGYQQPLSPIRYRSEVKIKFRSAVTRRMDFFQLKTISAKNNWKTKQLEVIVVGRSLNKRRLWT